MRATPLPPTHAEVGLSVTRSRERRQSLRATPHAQ